MESGWMQVLEIVIAVLGLIKAIILTVLVFSHQTSENSDHQLTFFT